MFVYTQMKVFTASRFRIVLSKPYNLEQKKLLTSLPHPEYNKTF